MTLRYPVMRPELPIPVEVYVPGVVSRHWKISSKSVLQVRDLSVSRTHTISVERGL